MFNLKKIIAGSIAAITIMSVSPVVANAAWKQNNTGWWYTEGNSWATGWRVIDGNWYYFYSNGYMAHDTTIDGYYLNSNGAWTQDVASQDNKAIKEGTYKVGQDIQAGEYLVKSTSAYSAYYECSSDSTGKSSSIIFNGNISEGSSEYITLKEGEYITIDRGVMYAVADAPSIIPSNGLYKEGMYKVGQDISAGEYVVTSNSPYGFSAYIEVNNGSRHSAKDIVSNDAFKGTKYITVEEGQYLTIQRAEIQK